VSAVPAIDLDGYLDGVHIGVTGTRWNVTTDQRRRVGEILDRYLHLSVHPWLHHGDCVGGDEIVQSMARARGFRMIVHPPVNPRFRAWCTGDMVHEPLPYMARNQEIVDSVERLIVVPQGPEDEYPRSGTWATYRRAVRAGVPCDVVLP
jgi:hypothetical protein